MTEGSDGLFAGTEEFPNSEAAARLEELVGMEERLERLTTEAVVLLDPERLHTWSRSVHGTVVPGVNALASRTPLFVFAGDVGVGKTELAEVLGQAIAQEARTDVTLYPLSLTARGRGAVGEMTTLLTKAFEKVSKEFGRARGRDGKAGTMGILLIDEADALAQSRELAQMHHEDRAGVNALLRGIDGMRVNRLPVLTILCTNRLDALDPAVVRRAASIEQFERPSLEQRAHLLNSLLAGTKLSPGEIEELAARTGPDERRGYGYTYSDLRQRLVPQIMLAAFRSRAPVTMSVVETVLKQTAPTRPFDGMSP
jgi:AAA+ superfamily predicted ATPase